MEVLSSVGARSFIRHSPSDCWEHLSTLSPLHPLRFSAPHNIIHLRGRSRHAMQAKTRYSASANTGTTFGRLESSSAGSIGERDLLIVGPGVLGRIVAEKWNLENPGCKIFGQTMTTNNHDELQKMGITPSLRGSKAVHAFPYVIFCAPPYQSEDYPSEVRLASSNWSGEGSFLFTSSTSIFDGEENSLCSEDTRTVPLGRSPRTDALLKAENEVLDVGGCVLRLAGLYKSDRGAHAYWLEKGTLDLRPDFILNLIHYEDAASLAVTILKKQFRARVFLGCDNHPLSSQEVMDLVNRSKKYSKTFQGFTGVLINTQVGNLKDFLIRRNVPLVIGLWESWAAHFSLLKAAIHCNIF